jgi:hypothetical protein
MIWTRRHMLRKTHPTASNDYAARAFTVSGVLITIDAVLIMVYAANEARLTAKYPDAEDMAIVAKGLDTLFARAFTVSSPSICGDPVSGDGADKREGAREEGCGARDAAQRWE